MASKQVFKVWCPYFPLHWQIGLDQVEALDRNNRLYRKKEDNCKQYKITVERIGKKKARIK